LAQHALKLESQVVKRTLDLTATNRRLQSAVESNRRGKEQYRELLEESHVMQAKLRHLTRQIITAQEEERKQISRELHDEVVQTLIGINVELTNLDKAGTLGAEAGKKKIAHVQQLVEDSVNAVHRFARGLRPAVLDDLGLIPALHAYCKGLTAKIKLNIQLTAFRGVEGLDGRGKTALFRVAQEALTNIVRHAHATQVKIRIVKEANAIRMEISDNGQSFRVANFLKAKSPKRLGLVGMKERIEMVGGRLAIESLPGTGTTVRADIPFRAEKKQK
jgi:signal transduction histidine kinase